MKKIKNRIVSIVLNKFKYDSRVLRENKSLYKAGYDVTVVALHEGDLLEEEINDNVKVHRIKLITKSLSKIKYIQLIKYIEYVYKVSKKYWKADIIHCNDLNTLPIGALIKILFNRKVKIVYDAHEYETEVIGLSIIEKKVTRLIENKLIKFADEIITVSESIAKEYMVNYKIRKPDVILNCPYYKELSKSNYLRKKYNLPKGTIVYLYQGGLNTGRGINEVLDVFDKINDKNKAVVFMGYGSLKTKIERYGRKHKNIFYHPPVDPTRLIDITNSADVGLSLIENCCLSYYFSLPNKLFEYLMADIPVIVSNLYEMRKLISEYKVGMIVDLKSKGQLEEVVLDMTNDEIDNMKKNIKKFKNIYNWEKQEIKLLEIYNRL